MVEKKEIAKEKAESSGLFDFQAFYSFAHSWLKEKSYGVNEDKYSEKLSGNKRDVIVEWTASKDINDYFRFEEKIKMEVLGLTDVEAEIDGEKKKMNQGKISLEIKGIVIRDRKNKWEKSSFLRFVREIYDKHVIPSKIDEMNKTLIRDVIEFKEEMKSFLELVGRR